MSRLEEKVQHAEQLLFDLAAALRRVPLEERTKRLHLRALELKRDVVAWRTAPPDPCTCEAVLDELQELARQARAQGEQLRTARELIGWRPQPKWTHLVRA